MRLNKNDKKNIGIGLVVGGLLCAFLPTSMNPFFMVKEQIQKMGGNV